MNKIIYIVLLAMAATQITKAQGNIASGSVKDANGKPLHFVFVGDVQNKNAVFTDTLGNFSITVRPDSKLAFEREGYKDTVVNPVNTNSGLLIILKSAGTGPDGSGTLSTKMQAQTNSTDDFTSINEGGLIAPGHQKGDLRGSQYLFDAFVHGYFINTSDELTYQSNYLLDYDKVSGAVLLTPDKHRIVNVVWDQIKSFTLYSMADQRFDFEKVPAIDNSHFVQVLASGPKYKIYKLIKTRFVKSDYVNNGIAAHGHDYDEYVDDAYYYVLDAQGGQPQKLSLRKKSIKQDFAKDAAKVNKYLSDNSGDIDDAYLTKLGAFMNN